MGFAAFNDSQAGIVLSNVLHTLGAIAMLGGLVAFMVWDRHRARGREEPDTLLAAGVLTVAGIVVNLLGGFLRTYQSDHPGLSQFGTSAWVRVLVVKHVFLFAGMAAALAILFWVAPRLRAGRRAPGRGPLMGLALGGIFVAALLGAVSAVTPLPGAQETVDDTPHHEDGNVTASESVSNATGSLTSTPVAPAEATGDLTSPTGMTAYVATLTWSPPAFVLGLEVTGPEGGCFAPPGTAPTSSVQCSFESERGPAEGPQQHSYRVYGDGVVLDAQWTLQVRWRVESGNETTVADTVTIAPGAGYEINTEMPADAEMHWDFTADGTLHFNLHSHFDGAVQDWVDMDTQADTGSFRVERKGGYSYYWTNDGNLPVELTYRVWGPFTVDSIVGV